VRPAAKRLTELWLSYHALTPWRFDVSVFLLVSAPVLLVYAVQQDSATRWMLLGVLLLCLPFAVLVVLTSRRYEDARAPRPRTRDLRRPDGQSPPT
jgi:hypothetical protein